MWHHCRARRFFAAARWCTQQVGLVLAELIVIRLLAPGAPITVAVDDTLFRRRGKKVHGAGWYPPRVGTLLREPGGDLSLE